MVRLELDPIMIGAADKGIRRYDYLIVHPKVRRLQWKSMPLELQGYLSLLKKIEASVI
jgi:hypothetical protein